MTFRLVVTDRAHSGIQLNALWWAVNHSVDEAVAWQSAVYEQLAPIIELPESHLLCPEKPHFAYELREKNVGLGRGGYHVIFTVRDEELLVLAVRSGSEQPLRLGDFEI